MIWESKHENWDTLNYCFHKQTPSGDHKRNSLFKVPNQNMHFFFFFFTNTTVRRLNVCTTFHPTTLAPFSWTVRLLSRVAVSILQGNYLLSPAKLWYSATRPPFCTLSGPCRTQLYLKAYTIATINYSPPWWSVHRAISPYWTAGWAPNYDFKQTSTEAVEHMLYIQ